MLTFFQITMNSCRAPNYDLSHCLSRLDRTKRNLPIKRIKLLFCWDCILQIKEYPVTITNIRSIFNIILVYYQLFLEALVSIFMGS